MPQAVIIKPASRVSLVSLGGRARLALWEKAAGVWKKRMPRLVRELSTIRREWARRAK